MICDQCSKKRRKCNREQPTCSRCIYAEEVCTWNRSKSSHKKHVFDSVALMVKNKKALESKSRLSVRNHYSERDSELTTTRFFIITNKRSGPNDHISKNCTFNLHSVSNWIAILSRWTINPISKRIFLIFLHSCGISLENLNNSDKKFLCDAILDRTQFPSIPAIVPLNYSYQDREVKEVLRLGTESYFYYFNSFWPLMTYRQFIMLPRSELLELAISTAGLCFLPRSTIGDKIMKVNSIKLRAILIPSKLVFSLETAQTMLILSVFYIHNFDPNTTFYLIDTASLIIRNIGFRDFSSRQHTELIFARRFINNIEATYLNYFRDYSKEYLSCFRGGLNINTVSNGILSFSIGKWKTTLNIRAKHPILDSSHFSQLEEIMLLVVSESTTMFYKKVKDFLNMVSWKTFHDISVLLVHINSIIEFIFTSYREVIKSIKLIVKSTLAAMRNVINIQGDNGFVSNLITKTMLLPILHDYKIKACYSCLQVLDAIPKHHYEDKTDREKLYNFSMQSLYYSFKLIYLIQQVTQKSTFVHIRSRFVFMVYRITMFHSHFIASHFTISSNFQNATSKVISISREMQLSYLNTHRFSNQAKVYQKTLGILSKQYS